MRAFTRGDEPDFLAENGSRWSAQWVALIEKKALSNDKKPAFAWCEHASQKVNRLLIPYLSQMTLEHCSFCDAFPVAGVSNETIEHFQPKSLFPHLSYTWANLYYCCNACQSSKLEKWDELLIRPDSPDYEFSRFFEFDFTNGQIRPNSLASEDDQRRAQVTIEIYGLDSQYRRTYRTLELRKWSKANTDTRVLDECAYREYLSTSPE
jgi:uncharacterized protein (TIGR02646 family)